MRGKAKASLLLAIDDIRRRGCAAAGVRLAGPGLSAICRLDLYGAWRLLTVFEAPDRCIVLLVAEHARRQPVPACIRRTRHQRTPGAAHQAHVLRYRRAPAHRPGPRRPLRRGTAATRPRNAHLRKSAPPTQLSPVWIQITALIALRGIPAGTFFPDYLVEGKRSGTTRSGGAATSRQVVSIPAYIMGEQSASGALGGPRP
jgi:hypothetical protein